MVLTKCIVPAAINRLKIFVRLSTCGEFWRTYIQTMDEDRNLLFKMEAFDEKLECLDSGLEIMDKNWFRY